AGIEDIIKRRLGNKQIGFGPNVVAMNDKKSSDATLSIEPKDLMSFGLIPEFVGRLPVIAPLEELDEAGLVRVLTEQQNAIVKQFQKLFDFNNVELRFTDGAVREIARKALKRKTGARGLRAILEEIMLDTMYDVPSVEDVKEVVVSENVILNDERPLLVY